MGTAPPDVGVAVKTILSPSQIGPAGFATIDTDGLVGRVTSIIIAFEFAVGAVIQFSLEVSITVTISPSLSVAEVKVFELIPTFNPLICHWYVGPAPPLVGNALKVTNCPGQIAPAGSLVMITEGVNTGFTVMLTKLETAAGDAGSAVSVTPTWLPIVSV